jgi:hypothetical protein
MTQPQNMGKRSREPDGLAPGSGNLVVRADRSESSGPNRLVPGTKYLVLWAD